MTTTIRISRIFSKVLLSRPAHVLVLCRTSMSLWLPKGYAEDGPAYPGTEDCRHHFNHVEERSEFRRQTVASASSLSLSGEEGFPSSGILCDGGQSGSGDARFERSISQ